MDQEQIWWDCGLDDKRDIQRRQNSCLKSKFILNILLVFTPKLMWTIANIKNIFYNESFQITKIFGFERYLKWDPYYICEKNIHRLSKVHLKYLFLLSYELEHCNNIELNLNQSLKI
jgi:hypothetical protein